MEADSAPFTPLPPSFPCFLNQRKIEADVEEYQTVDLLLRKQPTNQLSHTSSYH